MIKLLTKSDMAARWGVTRHVVHNWSLRDKRFPKEAMRVENGRMPLYKEEDVIKYEKEKGLVK